MCCHGDNKGVTSKKVSNLIQKYHESLPDKAETVAATWRKVESDSFSTSSMNEMRSLLHKLAGSAGMYGYGELASDASKIEEVLIAQLDGRADGAGKDGGTDGDTKDREKNDRENNDRKNEDRKNNEHVIDQQWRHAISDSVATFVQSIQSRFEQGV